MGDLENTEDGLVTPHVQGFSKPGVNMVGRINSNKFIPYIKHYHVFQYFITAKANCSDRKFRALQRYTSQLITGLTIILSMILSIFQL